MQELVVIAIVVIIISFIRPFIYCFFYYRFPNEIVISIWITLNTIRMMNDIVIHVHVGNVFNSFLIEDSDCIDFVFILF